MVHAIASDNGNSPGISLVPIPSNRQESENPLPGVGGFIITENEQLFARGRVRTRWWFYCPRLCVHISRHESHIVAACKISISIY